MLPNLQLFYFVHVETAIYKCSDGTSWESQPLKYWFQECFTLFTFLNVTVSFLNKFLVPLLFSP